MAEPLPQVPGPKLGPFTPTAHADIEFIQELGNPSLNKDSRVWKVRINQSGPDFALKLFYFSSADYLADTAAGGLTCTLANPQLYIDYFDAFSCECRAYGRLKDENREDLAVRAHGYLFLTQEQEATISKKILGATYKPDHDEAELDGRKLWNRCEEHRHLPIRAIVKDLATDPDPLWPAALPGMWSDVKDLHRLGILVRDITVFNYIGAKLVDFSRAWTWPHPAFVHLNSYYLDKERKHDPHALRMAIIDYGTWKRWDWDKVEIPEELTKCDLGWRQHHKTHDVDPRDYDWLRWEKDPAEADAFLSKNCTPRI
ncbi:51201625-949d-47d4-967e-f4f2a0cb2345 [Thermothielavioides terrestris]|uniref:Uncharacterized protein n=2 Tax=Thermothielavioides terrestris TaxID=2587410 RepID=G2QRQ9_THETT|nr:uncharacterized protein THITE_2110094 [Thermothielavioides terrestris NRRL 8126]AEO64203.1 hypothetical protein THITE_2110094 [Thermothielavioides terrestris NRRL 8126]SPQ26944.1 51201625-949d-47d4-967e-f4f2a0cb2345 [Thermothielavioides terrestris]